MSMDGARCAAQSHGRKWSWQRWLCVPAVVVLGAALLAAQGPERSNRITGVLCAGAIVPMAGTVHPLARRATDLGAVNPAMRMESLTLNASLSAAGQTALAALLEAQQDATSPQYHQWLTQAEYGARFGLTDADLEAVTGWLKSQGFTVKGVSRSRNGIYFGGTAGQVESAFHTALHHYKLNGETHFANATDLRVPAGLASVMLNMRGLNDFRLKPQLRKRAVPAYTAEGSDGIVNFLTPADWATIYNVTPIYDAGYTGTNAYVGVVGQTYAPESDITNFRSAAGLGATNLIYACIDPLASNCTGTAAISTMGDLDEADLDIEWSGGIAKNATVVFVYAPWSDVCSNPSANPPCTTSVVDPVTEQYYGVFDALQRAVEDYTVPATGKVLPVISMSYTDCEESFAGYPSYVQWVTDVGEQANSQGQTIVVAAGDTGAFECDSQTDYPASQGVSVSVPVDSPNYTGVGGTTLSGDESDAAAYWNDSVSGSEIIVDSAKQYIPEIVWNDTAENVANDYYDLSASGGGVSLYYAQPSWQPTPSNYSGTSGRFVPDVAFAASPNHDGYLTCSAGNNLAAYGNDCTTGFLSSEDYWDVIGGTSAGAPSFAGMLTLLVQKYGNFGNINQKLYELAANATTYAAVFHDITSGDNIVPCTAPTMQVPDAGCVGGEMGWYATTGYDLTTGLGSIDGYALYKALGTSGLAATTTTAEASPSSVAMNGTFTLTASVKSSGTGIIAGSVTFKLGSTSLGTGTVSSGVATLSNVVASAANGFIVGTNRITASYGGSTLFAASSGTTSLTVTLPATTTTTTATATPISVATGGTVTLKATVSSGSGTPTGTVTFTAGSATLGTATLSTGVATLSNVAATAANGLGLGEDEVTASYPGNASYAASRGSVELMVYNPALPLPLSLAPTGATAGGAGFTLTVSGGNFASTSRVLWNGAVRATTYVNSTQLTATISAADIAKQATNLVTVASAAPDPGTSSALPFVVQSSAPVPMISGGSIAPAADGSDNYALTLTGTGFVTGSLVDWSNTSFLTTSYVSPWQISATITASEYTSLPAPVKVENPSGGTSPGFVLP